MTYGYKKRILDQKSPRLSRRVRMGCGWFSDIWRGAEVVGENERESHGPLLSEVRHTLDTNSIH